MPSYVKFMKEILFNKRKIEDYETVALTEECSAIIQKKLPQKFGLGKARPTTITLQLANRSLTHPQGIIEDVLIKVDKLIFPADFIVLDMEEDDDVPIILGRPFLATGQALIDVQKGELRLRVQDDKVVFNVFRALKYPRAIDSCFSVNVIEEQFSKTQLVEDPLEMNLNAQGGEDCDGIEVLEYINWLNSAGPIYKKKYEELGQGPERPLPSIKKPPVLLKTLPDHLKYAYLGKNDTLPVIIFASLSTVEEEKLLRVLRAHKLVIGWTLVDIKGISPSIVMHCILMEEDSKASIDAQRRLNPAMKEVVRKEIFKWLYAGVIYPISDNGYTGYHQIPIAPEDQEKTTFTCPYGTFAFPRMPFGLCNAPATFQRRMMSLFFDMVEKSIEIFMVDFSIFGPSFDMCLQNLEKVLKRCEKSNLVLNWEKCHFIMSEGIFLGHKISNKGVEVDRAKVSTIENLPPPI
ncbi:uncharacterized protein LOC133779123 [Humulus lupulus]|uniref:uncharacterized protein LOC133779123 n=1 Tax=Humulus lupulus TaxID=3486 RepID=UPI002B403D44|nr:uncharacterized protein LOC133779123 [Humulus lupulus]